MKELPEPPYIPAANYDVPSRFDGVRRALAAMKSAILSGESWSERLGELYDEALPDQVEQRPRSAEDAALDAFDATMQEVEPWASGPVSAKHRDLFLRNLRAAAPFPGPDLREALAGALGRVAWFDDLDPEDYDRLAEQLATALSETSGPSPTEDGPTRPRPSR